MTEKQIVLTGGPGAGKTAVLEIMRHHYPLQVMVLPEAAGIVFSGGFPREKDDDAKCAAQRAIYHVQVELEALAQSRQGQRTILCDRGTIDGLAYWPGVPEAFLSELHTTYEHELMRYQAVIHLHPPKDGRGYNHTNKMRVESPAEALAIDARIVAAWSGHQRRTFVEASDNFLKKAEQVIAAIEAQMTS